MNQTSHNVDVQVASVPDAKGSGALLKTGSVLAAIGLVASLAGGMMDSERIRTAYGYLWGFTFVWSISLGALLLVALHHLTKAVWSVVFRRLMEMLAAPLWIVAILFVPIVVIAVQGHDIGMFPWLMAEHTDHIISDKEPFLNLPFFLIRAGIYFVIWIGFSMFFVRRSLAQDNGKANETATVWMRRLSAPFVLLFAVTITFAGIDWLMSLEPLWFSTMFGVYVFAGMMVSALAAVTLFTLVFSKTGRMGKGVFGDDQLYSLGTLMFAFTVFWAYIAFSQYMLIWYANLPEENFFMLHRLSGAWQPVSLALAVIRFVVPFVLLLSRPAKTNRRRLLIVGILILIGQLLDLYWLIMPNSHADIPMTGWQELGPLALNIGVFSLAIAFFVRRHKVVPTGDPLLKESICFRL